MKTILIAFALSLALNAQTTINQKSATPNSPNIVAGGDVKVNNGKMEEPAKATAPNESRVTIPAEILETVNNARQQAIASGEVTAAMERMYKEAKAISDEKANHYISDIQGFCKRAGLDLNHCNIAPNGDITRIVDQPQPGPMVTTGSVNAKPEEKK